MKPRRLLIWALAGLAIYVAFTGYRISQFRAQAEPLVEAARRFPSTYALGKGRPFTYVSLGDSTVAGVGVKRVEESLPYLVATEVASSGHRVVVHNLGVSGARIEDVVQHQLPKLPQGPLPLVTVSVSANDATHGTELPQFERNLRNLLRSLDSRGAARVVLTTTPNFRSTPGVPLPLRSVLTRRASRLSETIRKVANEFSGVRIADLYNEGTLTTDQYAADGFHPSQDGYAAWALIFNKAVNHMGD